ncbi:MAG TPA: SpaA isopeptide-forming pilin-related protein, partial [Clostridia bacterium]|nr:SpaA isopeptide-forming pilin-related protein [Clostridia bacterium]
TAFAAPLQSVASAGGVIRFENLAPGDYIVREIEAPLGYKVWTSGVPVSLVLNAAANTLPDAEIVEPIADELLTASVILHKAGETGKALSGGLFGIFRAADTAFATPLQSVASAGGVIRFDNLTPSDYVVRELEAPFGYEVWESDVPVSLVVDPATNTMPDTKSRRRSSTCAFALPSCCIRRTNTTARSAAARSRSSPLPTRRSQRRCRASPR